jgi:predicted RNA binding protein YcfA (HicA-like mRNA interferase family)
VPALSSLPTHKVVKAFERDGWILRQGGKHMVLVKPGHAARLVIPRYNDGQARPPDPPDQERGADG